jgi:hypothetical protein
MASTDWSGSWCSGGGPPSTLTALGQGSDYLVAGGLRVASSACSIGLWWVDEAWLEVDMDLWVDTCERLLAECENHGGFLPRHSIAWAKERHGVEAGRVHMRFAQYVAGLRRQTPFELSPRQALRVRDCDGFLDAWTTLALEEWVPRLVLFADAVLRAPRLLVRPLIYAEMARRDALVLGTASGPYACAACGEDAARSATQLPLPFPAPSQEEAA